MAKESRHRFFSYPECPSRIACDGAPLVRDRQVCGKCEAAMERRNKVIQPRGINYQDKTDKKYKGLI